MKADSTPQQPTTGTYRHHTISPGDCDVLRRLCDDTYVLTQPWPLDFERDKPYFTAVIAQVSTLFECPQLRAMTLLCF